MKQAIKTALLSLIVGLTTLTTFAENHKQAEVFQCLSQEQLPIVYHEKYNISCGAFLDALIGQFHPFDGKKYSKVYAYLRDVLHLEKDQFYEPQRATDADLAIVHSQAYLKSLSSSKVISRAIDLKEAVAWIPNHMFQKNLLDAMRYATNGSVLAADLALKHGWAINIGGGYHHAKYDSGAGGCIFGDIQLAIEKLWLQYPDLNVLIVDLDAHQGNGYSSYFKKSFNTHDQKVFIFDMYNKNEYPFNKYWDEVDDSYQYLDFGIPLNGGNLACKIGPINCASIDYLHLTEKTENRRLSDKKYLGLLHQYLPKAINMLISKNKKPGLIIYNAGTDPFKKDSWGGMNVSYEGIIARDAFVWQQAKNFNIPIMMVTSGGYSAESPHLIAATIKNVLLDKQIIKQIN